MEKTGNRFWPVCQVAGHDEDGNIICKDHTKSYAGCKRFPWHPEQLSNVDRDDLPRIPVHVHGEDLELFELAQAGETVDRKPRLFLGLPKELEGKAPFVGWAPFSRVCPYKFNDVTNELSPRERDRVKPAKPPIVTHTPVGTRFAG